MRHRRSSAAKYFAHVKGMKYSKELWNIIPWQACSGDETDTHESPHRYIITTLEWRSEALRQWMQVFDDLHLATRFNYYEGHYEQGQEKTPTCGNYPHRRVEPAEPVSERTSFRVVKGLPRNFYDSAWLRRQDKGFRKSLSIKPEVDLAIPKEIHK